MRYGSDLVVEFLAAAGIEYVALNPGASFRGLHDSLDEARTPQPIVALHEEVASASRTATPSRRASRWRSSCTTRSGCTTRRWRSSTRGSTPCRCSSSAAAARATSTRRRPWIDWIHSGHPESAVIRDIVKWDAEPASLEALPETLARALRIATTPPMGPVYVAVDALLQEAGSGGPSGGLSGPAGGADHGARRGRPRTGAGAHRGRAPGLRGRPRRARRVGPAAVAGRAALGRGGRPRRPLLPGRPLGRPTGRCCWPTPTSWSRSSCATSRGG